MYKQTFRSICILSLLIMPFSMAHADSIPVRFDQLEDFSNAKSPGAKILLHEFEQLKAQKDAEMAWSNPEISYNREKIERSEEYEITVSKTFSMPWTYMKKKSAWNSMLESAKLKYENEVILHLSNLKRDYVRIKLFDEYISRLGHLKELFHYASDIANSKYEEGHLSGIEEHLIQMVVISLQSNFQTAKQDQREIVNDWQAKLGINAEDKVELVTIVNFQAVDLKSLEKDINLIEQNPKYSAQLRLSQSFDKFASVARSKFLSDINIYGGYKKIKPNFNGHLIGVSVNIPLFNQNGAEVRKYITSKRIVDSETEILKSHLYNRTINLIESISESQSVLAVFNDHFEEDMEALDNLLYSYEEGWIDLNDLLNAIQIEITGFKDYFNQLSNYYSNIFELEAIIGKTLIVFNE